MADNTVSMTLVGDVYLRRDDPKTLFAHTGTHLTGADITFGNLEAPVTDHGTPVVGKTAFISDPKMIQALTAAKFDAVGTANNHSMDQGPQGLLQTLELLDKAKIAHTGSGHNTTEAHVPAIVAKKGVKVAFLSYASVFLPHYAAEENRPGIAVVRLATAYQPSPRVLEQPASPSITITIPNAGDVDALRKDIKNAKKKADIVVLSWHWGVSQGFRAMVPYQIEMGHLAIDAGADLIIGHHPHVLHGIEVYKGKVICYSMGNFAFPYDSGSFDRETIILKCQIQDKRIASASFVPAERNEEFQPVALNARTGKHVIDKMEQLSKNFGTTFAPKGDEVVIGPNVG